MFTFRVSPKSGQLKQKNTDKLEELATLCSSKTFPDYQETASILEELRNLRTENELLQDEILDSSEKYINLFSRFSNWSQASLEQLRIKEQKRTIASAVMHMINLTSKGSSEQNPLITKLLESQISFHLNNLPSLI
ncbi:MAG: hypothetical protein H0U75_05485 [Legionella sp.]|nr:hypothetical protein [Legionella sp.]